MKFVQCVEAGTLLIERISVLSMGAELDACTRDAGTLIYEPANKRQELFSRRKFGTVSDIVFFLFFSSNIPL